MGKEKIIISKEVILYLDDLIQILYINNYFGFIESAEIYVVKIYDFIEKDLVTMPHKSSPDRLKNHGSLYIFYKPNQRTTWYVFFEKNNKRIVVTSILNNHCEEARYLVETP